MNFNLAGRIALVIISSGACGIAFGLWQHSEAAGWFMALFAYVTAVPGWVKE
jgi:hypothetical protein